MENGDTKEAEAVLKKLVELAPDEGHEKYLYLGQLLQGEEAIAAYHKGIQILQDELDNALHQQSMCYVCGPVWGVLCHPPVF